MTNFSSGPCWLPGVVVNKSGPVSFIVKLLDDRTVRRHHKGRKFSSDRRDERRRDERRRDERRRDERTDNTEQHQ